MRTRMIIRPAKTRCCARAVRGARRCGVTGHRMDPGTADDLHVGHRGAGHRPGAVLDRAGLPDRRRLYGHRVRGALGDRCRKGERAVGRDGRRIAAVVLEDHLHARAEAGDRARHRVGIGDTGDGDRRDGGGLDGSRAGGDRAGLRRRLRRHCDRVGTAARQLRRKAERPARGDGGAARAATLQHDRLAARESGDRAADRVGVRRTAAAAAAAAAGAENEQRKGTQKPTDAADGLVRKHGGLPRQFLK